MECEAPYTRAVLLLLALRCQVVVAVAKAAEEHGMRAKRDVVAAAITTCDETAARTRPYLIQTCSVTF